MSTQSLLTPPISTDQTTSLSSLSTPARPESLYASIDLQLGAGAVIVQPSSNKVVLLSVRKTREDEAGNKFQHDVYFLPKGRKDIGETLEECATREGYEEVRMLSFLYLRP
jgi:ADP-ribose pyrophosphatase YjhB (NUDIX family)